MLKQLTVSGFKSFARNMVFDFSAPITAIVGPNGSGKSNVAEALRFVLGEQSIKSMRGKRGEDLIWSGSTSSPRGNRASAQVMFDNSSRFLNIDFDDVTIERIVHRDGVNDYLINGTQVRLKDVLELLAQANIGETGHHIISQGEADRILSASTVERKTMLEDALGLTAYQYKKEESERKLQKTEENIAQVAALRKEIAPHLRFLGKQVEKLEKAEALREQFREACKEYLKREDAYLSFHEKRVTEGRRIPEHELTQVRKDVARAREDLAKRDRGTGESTGLVEVSKKLDDVRQEKEKVAREAGRIEGQISFAESRATKEKDLSPLPRALVAGFVADARAAATAALADESIDSLRTRVHDLAQRAEELLLHGTSASSGVDEDLTKLRAALTELTQRLEKIAQEEAQLMQQHEELRAAIDAEKDKNRDLERSVFTLMAREQELAHQVAALSSESERLVLQREEFKRDLAEIAALAGRDILSYASFSTPAADGGSLPEEEMAQEVRTEQEHRKKELERMKIRLEEAGAMGGEEIKKEFKEVSEREAFFEKEIVDLENSAAQLKQLIQELSEKLETKFDEGLDAITKEFNHLFGVMFDGGTAALARVKEKRTRRGGMSSTAGDDLLGDEEQTEKEVDTVEGIEISVSLPRKRIKGLTMLSGGERALTSIALIFAMASVNPPPFLLLDETDAALDEANSRRYGDMIESLAGKSQLILITHNRETMSRASILYGVTMGNDGVSKVLSVKLEEAVAVAK